MARLPRDSYIRLRPDPAKGRHWDSHDQLEQATFWGELLLSEQTPLVARAQTWEAEPSDSYHIHYGMEICLLLSGAQLRYFEEFSFVARPGDVCLISFWEPHGWKATQSETRIVVVEFLPSFLGTEVEEDPSWLDLFAARPGERPQVTSPELRPQVMDIGEELWREISEQPRGWMTIVRSDLLRLLTLVSRSWRPESVSGPGRRPEVTALGQIMPAVTALQEVPGRRYSVAEAAQLCDLGPRQFHRLFTRAMGTGFHQFCLRARLAHVERLLATTNLPLSAIAQEADFSDAAHLHRAFAQHYHCTPKTYRERRRRGQ